jgi:predicted lactoylglutathione lyase
MPRDLHVNLPVKELERTVDSFAALGLSVDPKFTDGNATCMIINDSTGVMLLVESFFATFTRKPVADAHAVTKTLPAIPVDSRAEVDDFVGTPLPLVGTKTPSRTTMASRASAASHTWMATSGRCSTWTNRSSPRPEPAASRVADHPTRHFRGART